MLRPSSLVVACSALLVACGSDSSGNADRPTVVVTTSILGDVVRELVGDLADVEVIMPPGASPHEFQASAQQAAAMREAAVLVVNGGGFEEGLLDTIEAAEADGVVVFDAMAAVGEPLEFAEDAHGHEEDGEHAEDEGEHAEEDGEHAEAEGEHGHEGADPHFFTDPSRMATAATALVDLLATELPGIDAAALRDGAGAYLTALAELDAEVEELVAGVPAERRKLVTNHEVFGYFADRYGFEVVGAVIPGGGTQAEPSAEELAELAAVLEAEGVRAVFADTSSPDALVEALAAEVGDVEVVELFSESLGDDGSGGATYVEMVHTNAQRITDALGA